MKFHDIETKLWRKPIKNLNLSDDLKVVIKHKEEVEYAIGVINKLILCKPVKEDLLTILDGYLIYLKQAKARQTKAVSLAEFFMFHSGYGYGNE